MIIWRSGGGWGGIGRTVRRRGEQGVTKQRTMHNETSRAEGWYEGSILCLLALDSGGAGVASAIRDVHYAEFNATALSGVLGDRVTWLPVTN